MMSSIKRFVSEEHGMEFVEYGLIVAVMVLVAFGAWSQVGANLKTVIDSLAKKIALPGG